MIHDVCFLRKGPAITMPRGLEVPEMASAAPARDERGRCQVESSLVNVFDVAFEKARALPFARHGARGRRMLEMAGSKMNICVASGRCGEAARAHAC